MVPDRWNLRLNHHSPIPLWCQIGREVRRNTAERRLPVGHALPSVDSLAERLGLDPHEVRTAYGALQAAGYIDSTDGEYFVAQAVSMQYVQVLPGSRVTAPAGDPDMHSDLPAWLAVAIKVEAPGMEPIWYDSTRTTLIVS
jgi:DNA-binding transcriptional MocR family regulator